MAFFDIIIRKKEVIYMSLTAGIVGLPNVGKSTLFNAITKKSILMANYPFATIDPNVGVVIVPDERIDVLKNMYNPERVIPTTYEFTDIAGLVKGASNGEGLGNKFLSHIREVDAVVEVVRCFDDENIIHVDGSVDPIRDIEVINVKSPQLFQEIFATCCNFLFYNLYSLLIVNLCADNSHSLIQIISITGAKPFFQFRINSLDEPIFSQLVDSFVRADARHFLVIVKQFAHGDI